MYAQIGTRQMKQWESTILTSYIFLWGFEMIIYEPCVAHLKYIINASSYDYYFSNALFTPSEKHRCQLSSPDHIWNARMGSVYHEPTTWEWWMKVTWKKTLLGRKPQSSRADRRENIRKTMFMECGWQGCRGSKSDQGTAKGLKSFSGKVGPDGFQASRL